METRTEKKKPGQTKNHSTTYAPGRAVVVALQEAEAAFSDVQVHRSGVERVLSFLCSKQGLTLMFLMLAVGTHLKQTRTFLNSHVFHSEKAVTTAALGEEADTASIEEDSGEGFRSSLTSPINKASKNKKAMADHNSNTIQAADNILEDTN